MQERRERAEAYERICKGIADLYREDGDPSARPTQRQLDPAARLAPRRNNKSYMAANRQGHRSNIGQAIEQATTQETRWDTRHDTKWDTGQDLFEAPLLLVSVGKASTRVIGW